MLKIAEEQILNIGKVLKDQKRPLKERFRALFTLRNIGGPISIKCISECFDDESALLKHELAYCLGQMQDEQANDILIRVLEDKTQEPMVRHEAAEALGAIATPKSIEILEKYLHDDVIEVAETCELALDRIKFFQTHPDYKMDSTNPYCSVDPAPPADTKDINQLKTVLLNDEGNLFERYRAMFALRNIGNTEALNALGSGLNCKSALFKHEIGFVLGQIQDEKSVAVLSKSVEDQQENEMVRHECAEALGSIATDNCLEILRKYLQDDKRVVKESCEIALDMCEYENSPEFQYANTLQTI